MKFTTQTALNDDGTNKVTVNNASITQIVPQFPNTTAVSKVTGRSPDGFANTYDNIIDGAIVLWDSKAGQLTIKNDKQPINDDYTSKATGIANTKFCDLYRKGARVDAAITGSTQGLPVQIKRTNVPNKAIFNLIGIDENGNAIKGVQKEFDGAMREFIINLGALINNQQIRQDRPELSRIGDPRPEVLFSKNPEVDRIINLKDLFDIENNGIDKLLR